MPCTCDGYPEPEEDVHNGELADMLCGILAEHEARGEMSCFTKKTLKWWREHKKRDKVRLEQDLARTNTIATRQKAIAKLTPHERRVLGLE